MRYRPGHKAQTRSRLVNRAAREFRRHGLDRISVAALMHAEGLTHGGFYRHFKGKEALLIESLHSALQQVAGLLLEAAAGLPRPQALEQVIRLYLSERHMEHPDSGCAFAALGAELVRFPARRRAAVAGLLNQYRSRLGPLLPGETEAERNAAFDVLFPAMAGCLIAARSQVTPQRRKEVLEHGREFFIAAFCKAASVANNEPSK